MIGGAVLVLVAAALAVTAGAQGRPLARHRVAFDTLALVPEWRFYSQASMTSAEDLARDTHLVARDRDGRGRVGDWTPVLWPADRRLVHALWNPRLRVDALILSFAEDLAYYATGAEVQQSIPYLVALRCALAAPRGDAIARQFAVVHAIGRGTRRVSLDFVSDWHRW